MNIFMKCWDAEDRYSCNNLRIDGLKEVQNENLGQTELMLKSMIQEKLEVEDVILKQLTGSVTPITLPQQQ